MSRRTLGAVIALPLVGFMVACTGESPEGSAVQDGADFVFSNGKIYTVDESQPWAEAVVVNGSEIVYVGDTAGVSTFVGNNTETVDLGGRMVLPGFVDGHAHTVAGGLLMGGVDLQSDSQEEILERIRQFVAANPDAEVIQGYGVRFTPWDGNWPTAAMLDEIESERPVYLFAIDGHASWVNSKALELAEIDKDTPDTAPGFSYFERYEDGTPTGWIVELPAQMLVFTRLLDINAEYVARGVREWLPRFSAAGITSMQDYGIQGLSTDEGFQLMQSLEESGEMLVRLQGVYYWNDKDTDPVPLIAELKERYNSELVKATHLKINVDGGDDKWNAVYVDGYSDKPELDAQPIIPFDVITDALVRADAVGIDSVCHCFGDMAVRRFLDAVETAIETNPDRDRHFVVSHGISIHPDDIGRFAELGVTYDSSGAWMSRDPNIEAIATVRLGEERVDAMFPMKGVADRGGNVSLGSDWPVSGYVSEYRPLTAIQVAVTRQLPGRDHIPPLGGERAQLPLAMAIEAATLGAASGIGLGDLVGSIEVGKKADLVVLERNLFDIDAGQISETDVQLTMMNGNVTHRDGI